ncbi:MAG TPA: hypothetical protein VMV94_18875 [Phycisphaerae bacterium]|nr:hypothetical protein [Phycisphaerae bacterium]
MSTIESHVRKAQRRLWVNRWLRQWGWSVLSITIAWTIAWLADRLFALKLPIGWMALAGMAASLVISLVWLIPTREPVIAAAVALDQAAGLRERLASGLFAEHNTSDPFAQAVVADAERSVRGLSARTFVPIRWAPSLSLSAAMLAVALLSLLLPEFDLLGGRKAKADQAQRLDRARQVQTALAKPVSALQEIADKNPDLEMNKDIKSLEDALKRDEAPDANVLRRETVKKLDRLQDALKQKAESDRYQTLDETKKRLQQAGRLDDPTSELGKLLESMSAGDFQQAQQEIKQLQEKLAKRAGEGGADAKQIEQMRKQLDEVSKKLQKAGDDRQSKQELKNAGLSEQEAQRLLDSLAKKDPKQVEKLAKELAEKLKSQGMTEDQAKKLLNKIQQSQQAGSQLQQMGSKMASAAKQLDQGNTEAASSELGEAGEMLNEMEQIEQGLNDLQSQMAQLDQTRDELGDQQLNEDKCPLCNGTGFLKDGSPCPNSKKGGS